MFENIEIGDRVFDILYGEGIVVENERKDHYPLFINFPDYGVSETYDLSGRSVGSQILPRLYWSMPKIIAPEPQYKLKPCPFCGNKNPKIYTQHEMDESERTSPDQYTVCCSVDNSGCGSSCGYKNTTKEAVALWNRRF